MLHYIKRQVTVRVHPQTCFAKTRHSLAGVSLYLSYSQCCRVAGTRLWTRSVGLAHGRGPAVDLATLRSFSIVFAWTHLPLARDYIWNCFLFYMRLRQKQTPIKYGDQTQFLHKWKTDRTRLVDITDITSASLYHTLTFMRIYAIYIRT